MIISILPGDMYFHFMATKQKDTSVAGAMLCLVLLANAVILKNSYLDVSSDYQSLLISVPLLVLAVIGYHANKSSE
jgi:hypothetical protein